MPWRTNSTEDEEAVERHAAFRIGAFSEPVYKTGDWPKIMTDTLPPEILPRFTEEEKKDLLGSSLPLLPPRNYHSRAKITRTGSADFYAIDAYRTSWVTAPEDGIAACLNNMLHPLWPECQDVRLFDSSAGWAGGPFPDPAASWLQATPQFLRNSLQELQKRWPTKKMVNHSHLLNLKGGRG